MRKFVLSIFAVLAMCFAALAQNQQVSGTVTSEDGRPVAGVTVLIEGTQTGVITNNDGKYTIPAPANGVLLFTYIGMDTKQVAVGNKTRIDVVMTSASTAIDNVVVTAFGIQRPERSLGYGVAKVSADEGIQKAEPDLLRSLDGKIPGVIVGAPSGAAGSASRMTIRGNSSFLGNNQPLYIVDGVPYSNDERTSVGRASEGGGAYSSGISTLDPNDIESMSILKGAGAAAIYGSRAANGVVLITTKSGSKSSNSQKGFEVTFNGSYTVENITGLPDYQNTYGQGSQFKYQGSNGSWGPAFADQATIPLYADIASVYPNWAIENYPELGGMIPYQAYKNNVKDLFDVGGIYEGSVNVSNRNDKGNFGMTLSRLKQDSYIPESEFERFSISVGGNQKLENGLRVGGNVSYSRSIQNGAMYGNNQTTGGLGGMNSLARAFIMPRNWDIQKLPYMKPDGSNLLGNLSAQANNPYWAWENDKVNVQMDRSVANFNLGYDFGKHITVDYSFGFNDYKTASKEVINLGSRGFAGKGRIYLYDRTLQEMESTLIVGFNYKLTEDIGLKASLGHNFNQHTRTTRGTTGLNIINPGIYAIDNTESQTSEEAYRRKRVWGIFADVVLDYKQWLFLNLTGRNDRSSTLSKDNNSYFYPSVSSSFVFSEAFKISNRVIDFGKLRIGWAKVGNDADPYYYNGQYATESPYKNAPLMFLPVYAFDEDLKPEFTSEVEAGLEMQFFRGRLGFDLSVYNRNSTNQIAPMTLPASTGYRNYYTNFGKMNNRGIELGLNAVPVATTYGLTWSIFGTYTKNTSEVKELVDGLTSINVGGDFSSPRPVLEVGHPYGVLKGTVLLRDEDGTPLVDPNSGFYVDAIESDFIGNPNPDYRASITNTLAYKGVTFNFMVDYQKGGCVYTTYVGDLLGRGVTKDTENRLGSRVLPGYLYDASTDQAMKDAQGNKIRNTIQISEADLYFSDGGGLSSFASNSADEVSVYDATTIRLREVSVGWNLPKKWLDKTFIGSVNVSVVGRNLWFYSPNLPKYVNYDPTASSYGGTNVQGIDYTAAPSTRRIGFNVKVTF